MVIKPIYLTALRAEAEAQLSNITLIKPVTHSTEELLHELHVHQIELEMQNEELRVAYNALEASRASYMNLYEFAPTGYLTLTYEGLIAELNLTGATLLGIERIKLINRHFASLVAPQDGDRWYLLFKDMLQSTEEAYDFELALQRSDNSVFHVQLNCVLVRADDKAPIVRIMITDITKHKRTELELRIAATAFEAQESITITDMTSVIMKVNKAFIEITGYTEAEVVGKKMSILKSGRHNADFYTAMWGSIERVGTWQGEIWNRRKNGEVYPNWLSITAVREKGGEVTHYVATHVDITLRKKDEAEKHRLTQLYAALSQCNQAIVRSKNKEELFTQVCRHVVIYGGMEMAWIGLLNKQSKQIEVVASYGNGLDYLEGIHVSANENEDTGRGPTGIALRKDHPFWCQDFQHDPVTAPWHESGEKFGWGAAAVMPLHCNGEVIGPFNLYSSEVNAFDQAAKNLLIEMATYIDYALNHFEHEAQRR